MSDNDEVDLCCLLWAREGKAVGLQAYEDRVLALTPEHRGQVLQRVKNTSDPADSHPAVPRRICAYGLLKRLPRGITRR